MIKEKNLRVWAMIVFMSLIFSEIFSADVGGFGFVNFSTIKRKTSKVKPNMKNYLPPPNSSGGNSDDGTQPPDQDLPPLPSINFISVDGIDYPNIRNMTLTNYALSNDSAVARFTGTTINFEGTTNNNLTKKSVGFAYNGGTINNNGTIYLNSSSSFGLTAYSSDRANSKVINSTSGIIKFNLTGSMTGMVAEGNGSSAQNFGLIDVKHSGAAGTIIGILSNGGIITNESAGTIYIVSNSGTDYGMKSGLNSGDAINNGNILIYTSAASVIGMNLYSSSGSLQNTGTIFLSGSSTGNEKIIGMESSTGNISNAGKISIKNLASQKGFGIYSEGGILENKSSGNIEIDMTKPTPTSNASGIWQNSGAGQILNNGLIYISQTVLSESAPTGKVYGIFSDGSGYIINNGNIYVANFGATIANTDMEGFGIRGNSNSVTNNGKIFLRGKKMVGLYSTSGDIYNNGTIDMTNATDSVALYSISGKLYFTDSGIICGSNNSCSTVPNPNRVEVYLGNNNKLFGYGPGGTFVASRALRSTQNFDAKDFGSGKFALGKNGSIEAPTISGDIYADRNIMSGIFSKTGTLSDALKGLSYGELFFKSLSPLYSVTGIKNTNNNYDIKLDFSGFQNNLSNKTIAKFFDQNFYDSGDKSKEKLYTSIFALDTPEEIIYYLESITGDNIFPSLFDQTRDTIKFSRDTLTYNVYENLMTSESTTKNNFIGGYNYQSLDVEQNNYVMGYKTQLHMMNLGYDYRMNDYHRFGFMTSLGKGESIYDGDSDYSTINYELSGQYIFSSKMAGVNILASPYFGNIEGKMSRKINYATGEPNKTFDSNVNTSYYGLFWLVEKTFETSWAYFKPIVSFDYMGANQGRVEEGGEYSVKLNKISTNSAEGGLGLKIGSPISLGQTFVLTPSVRGNYYHQFGEIYKELSGTFQTDKTSSINFTTFGVDRNYGDVSARLDFMKKDIAGLQIYFDYNFSVSDQIEDQKFSGGISYIF
ncbi:MAG: autotransporter outer membrane beta-barrel domain-containing protein [Fusobacteriaceae bacterium]